MKRCKRCILPEYKPDILIDETGMCSVCRVHEAQKAADGGADFLETDFVQVIGKYRGKHKYDCLVMCSGGKDSTAALYYMKRRYKTNPLAFTFDHGFETAEALDNVRRAVDALGVDFLFFKTDEIRRMFAEMMAGNTKAVICHPCSIWYMKLTFDMCARFDVPLIIAGWTKGQAARQGVMSKCACNIDAPEYASMGRATKSFLEGMRKSPGYGDFPASMEDLIAGVKKPKPLVLSPHWFLGAAAEDYVEIIKRECGWKPTALSYPANSTNCEINNLASYLALRHYGYTHYHIEMSKLIRQGYMTRQEALDRLKFTFTRDNLLEMAGKLGSKETFDDFNEVAARAWAD